MTSIVFTVTSEELWKCPKCGRWGDDRRDQGYNESAVFQEGVCFRWAEDKYTCCHQGMKTPKWMS